MPFGDAWRGRRVLVTGHTGFKGAWLVHWLERLGAEVHGFALAPDEAGRPLFEALKIEERCSHVEGDLRDRGALERAVEQAQPEAVLHLAAQALVRRSYSEPRETWESNVLGTVNLLEALRECDSLRSVVVVTSDKCYENRERDAGYSEDDALGGHDPYSASKAATELVAQSWRRSFFEPQGRVNLATARAGNVIGGGDRSPDRLVADFVLAMERGRALELRSPEATRPWQHVLEPLSGYLQLGAALLGDDGARFARAFNFGPTLDSVVTVEELAKRLVEAWGSGEITITGERGPHEAGKLQLDCSLAESELGWRASWDLRDAVKRTVAWHRAEQEGADLLALADAQLADYRRRALESDIAWAKESGPGE